MNTFLLIVIVLLLGFISWILYRSASIQLDAADKIRELGYITQQEANRTEEFRNRQDENVRKSMRIQRESAEMQRRSIGFITDPLGVYKNDE